MFNKKLKAELTNVKFERDNYKLELDCQKQRVKHFRDQSQHRLDSLLEAEAQIKNQQTWFGSIKKENTSHKARSTRYKNQVEKLKLQNKVLAVFRDLHLNKKTSTSAKYKQGVVHGVEGKALKDNNSDYLAGLEMGKAYLNSLG